MELYDQCQSTFDAAGVNLDDASHADDYEILLVLVGGFENDSYNRVLSLQRAKMPTYWQSIGQRSSLSAYNFIDRRRCNLYGIHSSSRKKRGSAYLS